MDNPMISVIVPVYKAEIHLDECIQSILAQTYKNFELILVDDGSPDKSGAICDHYAEQDNRIRVIHQKNSGVSGARNAGLELCTGKYISFIDSDDFVEDSFFLNAVEDIERENSDIYISGLFMETWENGAISSTVRYGITNSEIYTVKQLMENLEITYPQICICGPWCKLYKRSRISKHGIRFNKELNYGEDTMFNLQYFEIASSVYFSEKKYYHYRREKEDSLFSRFHDDHYDVINLVYGRMRSLINQCNCTQATKERFEVLFFSLLVGGIHEYYRFANHTNRKMRMEQIQRVSRNVYIQAMDIKWISGTKQRLIWLMLRFRTCGLLYWIFNWHYRLV